MVIPGSAGVAIVAVHVVWRSDTSPAVVAVGLEVVGAVAVSVPVGLGVIVRAVVCGGVCGYTCVPIGPCVVVARSASSIADLGSVIAGTIAESAVGAIAASPVISEDLIGARGVGTVAGDRAACITSIR